jgi:enamine deaminase RidA (YjgF/YER057c/UK114 family)
VILGTRGTRTIYISGQVAMDRHGKPVGAGDLAVQTEQVMRNLGVALETAGATFADVVKIVTYVVDYKPEQRAIVGKVRSSFFTKSRPPASTLVGVSALAAPEWLVEIEAVAVTD